MIGGRSAATLLLLLFVPAATTAARLALSTGVTLNYQADGPEDGPVLVLIHGWPDSLHSYDRLRPLLDPVLRVYAIDMRGFGQSGAAAGPYVIPQFAAAIVRRHSNL